MASNRPLANKLGDLKLAAQMVGGSLAERIPASFRDTFLLRAFGYLKIPLLAMVSPTVVELNGNRSVVCIPLRRKTKNHLGSMYFGALTIGADCAGGLLGMYWIRKSGRNISFVFKDFKAEFLKRPEADVHFVCEDGPAVESLVDKVISSYERENLPLNIVATVPSLSGDTPVAKFVLTLSLKLKK